LCFGATAEAGGIELQIEYATDLFNEETIRRMLRHWEKLLQGIFEAPEESVAGLSMLTTAEVMQLELWNSTRREYPREKTVVDLFADQVARRPDAVALVVGDMRLTYRELDDRAEQMAA